MTTPSPIAALPFLVMLLTIAVAPLLAPHWWERNLNKLLVGLVLAAPVVALYAVRDPGALRHTVEEYAGFLTVLAGLYVVAGGIRITGDVEATPLTNTGFLAVGSVLASCVGTTGAAMLLIRPLLETNAERRRVTHTVVFFIFSVANIGGMLTPLGDPPLLLGYLQGVPFTWTFRLWPQWAALTVAVLLVYFVWDTFAHRRESAVSLRRDRRTQRAFRVEGRLNFLWLGGVVAAVVWVGSPWRELAIVALGAASVWLTPAGLRRANRFSTGPIVEVAVVFLGLFLTMMPALDLLRARAGELGVQAPWQFFWATGLLSSVLDNAPTYLAFLALAQGLGGPAEVVGVSHAVLEAISVGAVAMGANTYIGNAPNFMVRAIAEEAGVAMPSFAGYVLYSTAILLPLFALVTVTLG